MKRVTGAQVGQVIALVGYNEGSEKYKYIVGPSQQAIKNYLFDPAYPERNIGLYSLRFLTAEGRVVLPEVFA